MMSSPIMLSSSTTSSLRSVHSKPKVDYASPCHAAVSHLLSRRAATRCWKARATTEIAEGVEAETYLGEKFVKQIPKARDIWQHAEAPDSCPIRIERLDHSALEVTNVEKSTKFYTRVLGFQQVARPDFPFGGAWLRAGGIMLHLIEQDPSVDRKIGDWKDKYEAEPQCWYIRRSEHKAFQVSDLETAEESLLQMGVEYHKFVVPGTTCAQIFLYDPDGNGIELGMHYGEVAKFLKKKDS